MQHDDEWAKGYKAGNGIMAKAIQTAIKLRNEEIIRLLNRKSKHNGTTHTVDTVCFWCDVFEEIRGNK